MGIHPAVVVNSGVVGNGPALAGGRRRWPSRRRYGAYIGS